MSNIIIKQRNTNRQTKIRLVKRNSEASFEIAPQEGAVVGLDNELQVCLEQLNLVLMDARIWPVDEAEAQKYATATGLSSLNVFDPAQSATISADSISTEFEYAAFDTEIPGADNVFRAGVRYLAQTVDDLIYMMGDRNPTLGTFRHTALVDGQQTINDITPIKFNDFKTLISQAVLIDGWYYVKTAEVNNLGANDDETHVFHTLYIGSNSLPGLFIDIDRMVSVHAKKKVVEQPSTGGGITELVISPTVDAQNAKVYATGMSFKDFTNDVANTYDDIALPELPMGIATYLMNPYTAPEYHFTNLGTQKRRIGLKWLPANQDLYINVQYNAEGQVIDGYYTAELEPSTVAKHRVDVGTVNGSGVLSSATVIFEGSGDGRLVTLEISKPGGGGSLSPQVGTTTGGVCVFNDVDLSALTANLATGIKFQATIYSEGASMNNPGMPQIITMSTRKFNS